MTTTTDRLMLEGLLNPPPRSAAAVLMLYAPAQIRSLDPWTPPRAVTDAFHAAENGLTFADVDDRHEFLVPHLLHALAADGTAPAQEDFDRALADLVARQFFVEALNHAPLPGNSAARALQADGLTAATLLDRVLEAREAVVAAAASEGDSISPALLSADRCGDYAAEAVQIAGGVSGLPTIVGCVQLAAYCCPHVPGGERSAFNRLLGCVLDVYTAAR